MHIPVYINVIFMTDRLNAINVTPQIKFQLYIDVSLIFH